LDGIGVKRNFFLDSLLVDGGVLLLFGAVGDEGDDVERGGLGELAGEEGGNFGLSILGDEDVLAQDHGVGRVSGGVECGVDEGSEERACGEFDQACARVRVAGECGGGVLMDGAGVVTLVFANGTGLVAE
jgi:hypothetical protein